MAVDKSGVTLFLVTDNNGVPHRRAFLPGDDLSGQPAALQAAAAEAWTAEAVAAWEATLPPVLSAEEALAAERDQMQCSRMQARLALYAAGLLDEVEAAVAAAPMAVQIAWADAVTFQRSSPTIEALRGAVGLTPSQVDDLFRTAATLSA
jgi:hypothetical protein